MSELLSDHKDTWVRMIARENLDLKTLETRNRDSLDFHEHSVGSIKAALEEAYEAGRRFGQVEAKNL